jgi:hypothetical protein
MQAFNCQPQKHGCEHENHFSLFRVRHRASLVEKPGPKTVRFPASLRIWLESRTGLISAAVTLERPQTARLRLSLVRRDEKVHLVGKLRYVLK